MPRYLMVLAWAELPNLFLLLSPVGVGAAINYVYTADAVARHGAYIVSEALLRCKKSRESDYSR